MPPRKFTFEPWQPPFVTVDAIYDCRLEWAIEMAKEQGYEPTGEFRPPADKEPFLTRDNYRLCFNGSGWQGEPRLIFKKIQRKQVIFTATGEVRLPRAGEWFMDVDGTMRKAEFDFHLNRWWIYTREDKMI